MNLSRKKLTTAIIIGSLVGISLAVVIAFAKISIHGKFPPGTNVAGIDISYLSPKEATIQLNQAEEKYLNTTIRISVGKPTATDGQLDTAFADVSPKELGLNILVEETIEAIEVMNAKNIDFTNLFSIGNRGYKKLLPIVSADYEKLNSMLETTFKLSELAPKPATFYFDENNKLAIREEQRGLVVIDYEKTINDLKNAAKNLDHYVEISLNWAMSPVTAELLEQQKDSVAQSLRHQVALLDPIYSDDWYLKLSDHLDWVNFIQKQNIKLPYIQTSFLVDPIEGSPGEAVIAIEINQDKLNEYIDENISKWLDREAEPVNIYTDETEKVIIEGKGNNGRKVQRKLLKEAIELAVANKVLQVTIPVLDIEPSFNISQDLQEKGIKERIGVGHTSYYRSPANRVHNIKIGAAKFNGLLIAPGETFSFNQNLGPVDASTGFKKELVIKKEGTIPEYGGGICQVSTTVFRAAIFAGLLIAERNQHSYAVSYYSQVLGHGLDATIYLGGADLKFTNDTKNHILIQTYTENDYELYIIFYGTPDGRSVEMEGPYLSNYHNPGPTIYENTTKLLTGETKQVEKPHTGFNALWYRHLKLADGTVQKEPIETHYKAVPGKILVGTAATEAQLTPE